MPMTPDDFEAFKLLVEEPSRHTERECQSYLSHAVGLLLPGTPLDIETVTEERNYFGNSDFVVAATLRDDAQREVREAYIWELKAPQCYLFEKDNNNRCRATPEFLKAENQLLHYTHQAFSDQLFRVRMRVLSENDIKPGGIIIGTRERFLKNSTGSMDLRKADMALTIRNIYLYKAHRIRVITWDTILDCVRPLP